MKSKGKLFSLLLIFCGHGLLAQVNFGPKTLISSDLAFVYDLIAEDIDSDGDLDLISTSYTDSKLAWYENLGGSFGPQQVIDNAANGIANVRMADITGDGIPDLALTLSIFDKVTYYPGLGGGNFGPPVTVSDTLSDPRPLDLADIDANGTIDIVVGSESTGQLLWYPNLGGGLFGTPTQLDVVGPLGLINTIARDIDNDGDLDVSTTVLFGSALFWYENLGGGVFSVAQYVGPTSLNVIVQAEDITGDGKLEMFCVGSSVRWWENLGPGGGAAGDFGPTNTIASGTIFPGDVRLEDLDNDGDKDAFITGVSEDRFSWYENTGAAFSAVDNSIDTTMDAPNIIAPGDFDGDGDIDVAVASYGDDEINWFENTLIASPCSTNDVPENPSSALDASFLYLSWDKVDQSIGCQINASQISPPGPSPTQNVIGFEVDSRTVPLSFLDAGTTWIWSVRCACSLSPIAVTSFSETDTFSVPLLRSFTDDPVLQLQLNPNPVLSSAQLSWAGNEQATVVVHDILGRQVQADIDQPSPVLLEMSKKAAGIYFATVTTADGRTETKSFVVK